MMDNYVSSAISELGKSILFVQNYIAEITESKVFDPRSGLFNDKWRNKTLKPFGLSDSDDEKDFDANIVYNSDYAKVADDFIRCMELRGDNVRETEKNEIMLVLLPIKTTISKMFKLLKRMQDLHSYVIKLYVNETNFGEEAQKIHAGVDRTGKKPMVYSETFITSETYDIDVNKVGYRLFNRKELHNKNVLPKGFLQDRISFERSKYYSNTNIATANNLLTNDEKYNFFQGNSFSPFVTPMVLKFKNEEIDVTSNLMSLDMNKIKAFRLMKSQVAFQNKSGNKQALVGTKTFNIEKTIQNSNISIGSALQSNLHLKLYGEETAGTVDSSEYLGQDSIFVNPVPEIDREEIKTSAVQDLNFKILSAVTPRRFLEKGNLRSTDEINLSKKDSKSLLAAKNNKFSFEKVPPQLKSLMSDGVYNNGSSFKTKSDPLKNQHWRPVLQETQLNVHEVNLHQGFNTKDNGEIDFNNPIIKQVSEADLGTTTGPKMFTVDKVDNPTLGLDTDTYSPPVFDRVLITAPMKEILNGTYNHKTSMNFLQTLAIPLVEQAQVQFDSFRPKFLTSNSIAQSPTNSAVLNLIKGVSMSPMAQQETEEGENTTRGGVGSMGGSSGGSRRNTGGGNIVEQSSDNNLRKDSSRQPTTRRTRTNRANNQNTILPRGNNMPRGTSGGGRGGSY